MSGAAPVKEDNLVLLIDDDNERIEISTGARISDHMIPVCIVETGFNEPMGSAQRRWAGKIVRACNAHAEAAAWLKASLNMVDGDGTPPNWDRMRDFVKRFCE